MDYFQREKLSERQQEIIVQLRMIRQLLSQKIDQQSEFSLNQISPVNNLQRVDEDSHERLLARGHYVGEMYEGRQDAVSQRIRASCHHHRISAHTMTPQHEVLAHWVDMTSGSRRSFSGSHVSPPFMKPAPPPTRPEGPTRSRKRAKVRQAAEIRETSPFTFEGLPAEEGLEEHVSQEALKVSCRIKVKKRSADTMMALKNEDVCYLTSLSPVDLHTPVELQAFSALNTPEPVASALKPRSKLPRLQSVLIRTTGWKKEDNKSVSKETDYQKEPVVDKSYKQAKVVRQKNEKHQNQEQLPSRSVQIFTRTLQLLRGGSQNWKKKVEGLQQVRLLAEQKDNILMQNLHEICLAVTEEVKNLRSRVSQDAIETLGHMYVFLGRAMDPEVNGTAKVLLQKAGESKYFIRENVAEALSRMVYNCSPARVMDVLLTEGLRHRNISVRESTACHLRELVEHLGAKKVLCGRKNFTGRFLVAISQLAQDSAQEVRYYAQRTLTFLAAHEDLLKMVDMFVEQKDKATIKRIITSAR